MRRPRPSIVGAPFDSGTSYRAGARMGPFAIRSCDYSIHTGSRPHLALRVDPLLDLGVVDAGDVEMAPTETVKALNNLPHAVTTLAGRARSRSSWAATTPSPRPTSPDWPSTTATAGSR